MSHKDLEHGFNVLKGSRIIKTALSMMMKGAFEFNAAEDIGIVFATFQNPFPALIVSLQWFLKNNGVLNLGDVLRKFAPRGNLNAEFRSCSLCGTLQGLWSQNDTPGF